MLSVQKGEPMSVLFTVEGKVVGRRAPIFSDWHIELPPLSENDGDGLRLRDFISFVVSSEVEAFRSRQQERRLARVMSKEEIKQSAISGKVDPGEHTLDHAVDATAAVAVALQAFEDGLYFVFIDEVQQFNLDSKIYLHTNSKVVFLRLTALTGG
jgi:hypothetical protein